MIRPARGDKRASRSQEVRRVGGGLPGWAVLIMPILLALVAAGGVTSLSNQADADVQEALVFSRFTELTERLHNLEIQAKQPTSGILTPSLRESAEERDLDLAVTRADLDRLIAELARFDPEDAGNVRVAVDTYVADAGHLAWLIETGQDEAAASWDADRLDASFSALRDHVRGQNAAHLREAQAMTRFADIGSVVMLLLTALTTGILFRRVEAARRAAAVSSMERRALGRSEARFRALVQHSSDVVAVYDPDGTIQYLSPGFTTLLGHPVEPWVGQGARGLVHDDDLPRLGRTLARLMRAPSRPRALELRLRHRDGSWRWVEAIATNLLDTPEVGGIVTNARDITERKALEAQLTHQAFHDSLTGLPNRALFLDRLAHALGQATRGGSPLAVLFLDLDRFKIVNDSLGHPRGDALLVAVAERLPACLRAGDTVARFGGDEFAVLLEDADERAAGQAADRIIEGLRAPIRIAGHDLNVEASIGIAIRSSPEDLPNDLLRDADAAMYAAKHRGKGGVAIFDASMRAQALEELELEADLRVAVTRGELRVYYQPIVQLATGMLVEVEALARWQHPTRGLIQPGQFIALAEETGLILPIGTWVLEEACRQVRGWQRELPGAERLNVAVNLSPWMLWHHALIEDVERILAETGLAAGCLRLEITEGTMMRDGEATVAALQRLKALGIGLAVDDFGTGYSSLAYLQRFPFDVLKIDRAFVGRLGESTESQAIVRAVIDLAQGLGLEVTAEGIETARQAQLVLELGSDRAQGYHFAQPLSADEFADRFFPAERLAVGSGVAAAA